jgi:hypothetical protein
MEDCDMGLDPITLAAIIGGVSSGAGQVAGAAIGSSGAKDAAQLQAQSAQNSLDFLKEQYAKKQSLLQPYEAIAGGAGKQLAYGLGINPADNAAATTAGPPPLISKQPGVPFQPNATVSLNGGPAMVPLRTQGGQTIMVPASAAPHLISAFGYTPMGQPQGVS